MTSWLSAATGLYETSGSCYQHDGEFRLALQAACQDLPWATTANRTNARKRKNGMESTRSQANGQKGRRTGCRARCTDHPLTTTQTISLRGGSFLRIPQDPFPRTQMGKGTNRPYTPPQIEWLRAHLDRGRRSHKPKPQSHSINYPCQGRHFWLT